MTEHAATPDERSGSRPGEIVSGYLAAFSIAASLLSLAWHTLRLSPAAMLIAVIAAGMAGKDKRLQLAACLIGALCFFLGMTISVAISRPLW
ncbi:MAG: hypothetical protein JOZ56_06960 [Actinobacteria bacterium]|nr:hypothetical protein [Actinomycetota bacterium]MBV8562812.1 hypothetical protein [Actinomycetota bacterium]